MSWLLTLVLFYIAAQIIICVVMRRLYKRQTFSPVESFSFLNDCTPGKPGVVLIHGYADTPRAWLRQAKWLHSKGYPVICPILSLEGTVKTWEQSIADAVKEIRKVTPDVWLWGHSMGGAMSLYMASRLNPTGLVLWAPYLAPRLSRALTYTLFGLEWLFVRSTLAPTFFPSHRTVRGDGLERYHVQTIITRRTFGSMLFLPELLPHSVKCPTFVMQSRNDHVVNNMAVQRRLAGATFSYAVNPRATHALTNASDWKQNAQISLDFIEAHHA